MNLTPLREQAILKLEAANTIDEIEALKIHYLGRKGQITDILKSLSTLPIEERKSVGETTNHLREELARLIDSKLSAIHDRSLNEKLAKENIDIFLPPFPIQTGHVHPIRQTMDEISGIFSSIGFTIEEGPEIETDWYNFEALNIPPDHPARDSQDTFFLGGKSTLLRTHTSPVQIRTMERQKPPIRIIAPGRVFRNEATDATHSAVFHQIEGLAVDKGVTFADLKGTLTLFIKRYFGSSVGVRFRPSHFQFTEPSAEVDIQCMLCGGKGCRVCKGEGWLEMLGCGMVHPNVLGAVKYDSEKYTGFAFGMGVERLTMFKYGIDDIRLFYENNTSFLEQF
jgi:phenylalanyl-tRNA synthetase alpha chain